MIPAESFYIRQGSSYNPVSKVKYTRILFKPLHEYTRRNNTIWLKLPSYKSFHAFYNTCFSIGYRLIEKSEAFKISCGTFMYKTDEIKLIFTVTAYFIIEYYKFTMMSRF